MITVGGFAILAPDEVAPADALPIRILPGLGWGVGWHPSTQAMLRAMEDYGLGGRTVVDVGTGVGTLAIAAHLLGASEVSATEMLPERAEKARRNFKLNEAPIRVQAIVGLDYDVEIVIANLGTTADTLGVLKHATGGFVVHVDEADVELVLQSAEAAGFDVEDVETVSNIGPKASPAPNFMSRVLVGKSR